MKRNWIPDRNPASAWLCLLLVLFLAGCAATSTLPRQLSTPSQVQTYKLSLVTGPGQAEDSLLVVQPEAQGASRWIQTNALGAPLARLVLRDGTWQTDGFLPPNPQARHLFEAIIAAQLPRTQWRTAYPDVVINRQGDANPIYIFQRQERMLWSLQLPADGSTGASSSSTGQPRAPAIRITLPDHSQWHVARLSPTP